MALAFGGLLPDACHELDKVDLGSLGASFDHLDHGVLLIRRKSGHQNAGDAVERSGQDGRHVALNDGRREAEFCAVGLDRLGLCQARFHLIFAGLMDRFVVHDVAQACGPAVKVVELCRDALHVVDEPNDAVPFAAQRDKSGTFRRSFAEGKDRR